MSSRKKTMLLIRNLIHWLIICLSGPLLFFFGLLSLPFHCGPNHVGRAWARVLLWSLKNIVGLNYRVIGRENIPDQPSIICCKHQSGWETLALQEVFPLQVYVAKKELFNIPFFGWSLRLAKTIGIDRKAGSKASEDMLRQGLERKKEGLWIAIFPEGTRIRPGGRGKYKQGAARMAKMLEMDMVPVAVNSGEFWPRASFLKYPGTITMVIGRPIPHGSGEVAELTASCENWIEAEMPAISGQGPKA